MARSPAPQLPTMTSMRAAVGAAAVTGLFESGLCVDCGIDRGGPVALIEREVGHGQLRPRDDERGVVVATSGQEVGDEARRLFAGQSHRHAGRQPERGRWRQSCSAAHSMAARRFVRSGMTAARAASMPGVCMSRSRSSTWLNDHASSPFLRTSASP